jgi:DNA polymerase sigma
MNTSSKSVIFNKAAAVFANLSELENSFMAAQQQMEQHKQMMLVIEKSLMETRTKAAEVENEVRALYMPAIVVSLPSSPVAMMTPSAFNQAPVASPSPTNLARRMTKEQVAALIKEDKKELLQQEETKDEKEKMATRHREQRVTRKGERFKGAYKCLGE